MNKIEKILWSDEFNLNVAILDYQHKMIIKLINETIDMLQEDCLQEDLGFLIEDLTENIEKHLQTEEDILKNLQYSGYREHQNIHQLYSDKFHSLKDQIDIHNTDTIEEFIDFIKNWWLEHILYEDRKFQNHLEEKGYK